MLWRSLLKYLKLFLNLTQHTVFCRAGKWVSRNGKNRRRTFLSEREIFIFRDRTVFKTERSEVLEVQIEEKENFDRGKESKPEIFFIPGSLTFQPYRCIFSICGASTNHKTSSDSRCYLWMPPNLDVVYGCPQQPLAQSKLTCIWHLNFFGN